MGCHGRGMGLVPRPPVAHVAARTRPALRFGRAAADLSGPRTKLRIVSHRPLRKDQLLPSADPSPGSCDLSPQFRPPDGPSPPPPQDLAEAAFAFTLRNVSALGRWFVEERVPSPFSLKAKSPPATHSIRQRTKPLFVSPSCVVDQPSPFVGLGHPQPARLATH